jgi:uncharacterized membrane protein
VQLLESTVYILCMVTSLVAMGLLLRSYRQNRSRLLLWSAAAFVAFALNNLLLFFDLVVLPVTIDLRPARVLTALIGVAILLYAFIWEID